MRYHSSYFYLLLVAVLLVSFGDLRNVITPFGYWLAWGAWLFVAICRIVVAGAADRAATASAGTAFVLLLGLPVLIAAFFLAAIINSDFVSAFHGGKLFVIFIIGVVIHKCGLRLTPKDIAAISARAVIGVLFVFLLSKYFFDAWFVELGDGRQGIIVALPGVLWKTGVYLAPFILANLTDEKHGRYVPMIALVSAMYLLILDGSRTGLLWSTAVIGLFGMLRFAASKRRGLMFVIATALLVATGGATLGVRMLAQDGGDKYVLAAHRLAEGDEVRASMIYDGVIHAEECLPWGCGFGTSVTETDHGPMVVHNAYLSSLGDVGLLGFVGVMLLTAGAIPAVGYYIASPSRASRSRGPYVAASVAGVFAFGFSMLLHPLSTEMSEWGWFLIMTSWLALMLRGGNQSTMTER